ncbi:MAG: hypothetical protein ACJ72I_14140 [Pseudonocardiaceae bacterium]|jgi:hypothetical protein
MNAPELAVGVMEVILRGLESLRRRGRGNPPAADRLDHRERFQCVRGIAQVLVGAMELFALLLREFRWLAAYLHVAPSELPIAVGAATLTQQRPVPTKASRAVA